MPLHSGLPRAEALQVSVTDRAPGGPAQPPSLYGYSTSMTHHSFRKRGLFHEMSVSAGVDTTANAMSPSQLDVLLISTASNIGGMERVVCGLARELDSRHRSVVTVFPDSENDGPLLEWCREQGVPAFVSSSVRDAAAPHRWSDLLALRRLVRRKAPAVVNLHYGDNFISLKDVIAVRLARTSRCVVSVHHPTAWDRTRMRKRVLTRLASWLAHDVTTFSGATADVLRGAGVRESRLHVIPCGVMPPAVSPTRDAARCRFGISTSAFVVGFLGRHVPHKRLDLLIDALSGLSAKGIVLLAAGDGPEKDVSEALARQKLGQCAVFTGRLQDTNEFYAACDIFVLPSELEGFGLVYIEAAFHGVPSIGTNVGGVPDAIRDGETGILVPSGNADALRKAIARLLSDEPLRKQMGEAARNHAYAELTEATMTDRFERLFRLEQTS